MDIIEQLAARQSGVLGRRQLYSYGVTRWQVRAHLKARRWQRVTDQVVCTYTGPLSDESLWWAAVLQGGPRAHLDGASALIASGLRRFESQRIRVTVPRGARVRRTALIDVRQSRRWADEFVVSTGIPRTTPAVAAVRGALWANTPRQAELLVTMAVQQRLVTPEALAEAALTIRRDRRRQLLHALIIELMGGAHSLGEIDVARECRRRGLPAPTRQVLRKSGRNRFYLDIVWEDYGLVVEVDGIQHAWVENVVSDALRQNTVALSGDTVLRLPLLGLRTQPDDFFAQIEVALRGAGWTGRAA